MHRAFPSIDDICQEFFAASARQFPIVSASDEFFYFPQVRSRKTDWSQWDTFSESAVNSFASRLAEYEKSLDAFRHRNEETLQQDLETQIDLSFLMRTITTLREQLIEVRTWDPLNGKLCESTKIVPDRDQHQFTIHYEMTP